MKQGFSLGMDVAIDENGKYNASISYFDTDENEIATTAEGKNIEEVCLKLYDQLSEEIAALEEAGPEDMTDEEYIAYLEKEIERLKAEKEPVKVSNEDYLKKINQTFKYYDQLLEKYPRLKYAFSW